MKVTRIVHGQGVTKNIGNFESIRIYNEIEAEIAEGEDVRKVQSSLKKGVYDLNLKDCKELVDKYMKK